MTALKYLQNQSDDDIQLSAYSGRKFIDVEYYNQDGSLSHYAMFVAAISALKGTDNILVVSGDYDLTGKLTIDAKLNILLLGTITASTDKKLFEVLVGGDEFKINGTGSIIGASNPLFTSNDGIWISGANRFQISDITIKGFYNGVYTSILSSSEDYIGGSINMVTCQNNVYGISHSLGSEYVTITNCKLIFNSFGYYNLGGNNSIANSVITNNTDTGVYIGGSGNNGHGSVNNNLINHNTIYNIDCNDIASSVGFTFFNNYGLGNGANRFKNCNSIVWSGGSFHVTNGLIFDNCKILINNTIFAVGGNPSYLNTPQVDFVNCFDSTGTLFTGDETLVTIT